MEILKFIVIEKIMKFFSLIITFSSLVFSQIIYIGPNSNTTQNGTLINPFTTIDKAMNATLNNSLYQNLLINKGGYFTYILMVPPFLALRGYWSGPGWTISIIMFIKDNVVLYLFRYISDLFRPNIWVLLKDLKKY